ncbi:prepilin peptidase [Propionibacteriaceae bacterium Y1700]|uniref:prepilin peptidase n=1 Tax=Microlunatus sp. Y1700 TaxID=3418487 RepID=UPI003DA7339A
MHPLSVVAAAVAVGVLMALITRPALRGLPEPPASELDDGETKVAYADLGTWLFRGLTGAAAAAGVIIIGLRAPVETWPVWVGLTTVGVLLAAIDAATTWLPLRLTHLLWWLTLIGVLVMTVINVARTLEAAACGLAMWLFFGAVWLISRGALGFGDVRLAPVLGVATGAIGWEVAATGLLAGCLIGALWGVLQLIRRRGRHFAYAPSLVIGSYLAVLIG